MNDFLFVIKKVGIFCLVILFCGSLMMLILEVHRDKKRQPDGVRIAFFGEDYEYYFDKHRYCSPMDCDGGCFICLKHVLQLPQRDDVCCVCGKLWHEHYLQRMSPKEWLEKCKQKDSYDYINHNAPLGYGDL